MTIFTSIVDEARKPELRGFYVPAFEFYIDGSNLPNNVLKDVVELTYRDDLLEIDQFELTVNNWDAAERRCKYIGAETQSDLSDPRSLFRLFEPCGKKVELSLGYVGRLQPVMVANFTTMEPNFPSSGPPALTVRGLNVLHQLRKKKYSGAWEGKTPSFIARNIATLRDNGQPRFPLPIAVDPESEGKEAPLDYVAQADQYDVDFLLNLARQNGYELEIQEADPDAGTPRRLWFGPGRLARPPVNYSLEWGRTLMEFKPSLTTANQWKSVTVRGWDRRTQKPIAEKITLDDPELKKMNANLKEMIAECDPREEQVVDRPVSTAAEAKSLARAMLRDRNANMVRATGATVGLPGLRAGTQVDIQGVGSRLSGTYLVTKTQHSFGEGGYVTRFECRREHFEGAAA